MKRANKVLNKNAVRAGRWVIAWAAQGMNWGDGVVRDEVVAIGRQLKAGGAVAADQIGRRFLAADAASEQPEGYKYGMPAACWTMTGASRLLGINPDYRS